LPRFVSGLAAAEGRLETGDGDKEGGTAHPENAASAAVTVGLP
jgi:hypothetical protein